MGDHHDHIHVGWRPDYGTNSQLAKQLNAMLMPSQWARLMERLGKIDNPKVLVQPSRWAIKTKTRKRR
jgi:hypothetical protein